MDTIISSSLRAPLHFDLFLGFQFKVLGIGKISGDGEGSCRLVVCNTQIMRAGKHYVTFDRVRGSISPVANIGIMRPLIGWKSSDDNLPSDYNFDKADRKDRKISNKCYFNPMPVFQTDNKALLSGRSERWGPSSIHACFGWGSLWRCSDWNITSKPCDPKGVPNTHFSQPEPDYGLLLDLDKGALSLIRNGTESYLIKGGLSGEYVWAVSFCNRAEITIKRAQLPDTRQSSSEDGG